MTTEDHIAAMRAEQARQIREHLTRYGDQMSDEARRRHSGRLIELERKEYP
jgi:hypothetical protein